MEIASIGAGIPGRVNPPVLQDRIEQAFLEEMLKYVRPPSHQEGFGGGHGEEQFSSFMNREYAALLAARLDLGLGSPE